MIERLFNACLITPDGIKPSDPGLEVVGVFNPGVAEHDGQVVIMARVAERPADKQSGWISSPRFDPDKGLVVDRIEEADVICRDPRAFEHKDTGNVRLSFISHVRVFRSADGRSLDSNGYVPFSPATEMEEYGVEDPRITKIGETFYITYVAVSRHGACTALASTQDFESFTRHGVIFPSENKDVVLFPEKIAGSYAALHRPNPRYHFAPPEMWIAYSPDLEHWGRHAVLHTGTADWETGRIGGGAPPVRTPAGWLEIYHGNALTSADALVGEYVASALVMDPADPSKIIAYTDEPIMKPETHFEREGFLGGIVFPTGIIDRGDVVQVFYGAADTNTAVVEFSKDSLLDALSRR